MHELDSNERHSVLSVYLQQHGIVAMKMDLTFFFFCKLSNYFLRDT